MSQKRLSPEPRLRNGVGAPEVLVAGRHEFPENNLSSPATQLAGDVLARRYRMPPRRARLLAELAGLGGAA